MRWRRRCATPAERRRRLFPVSSCIYWPHVSLRISVLIQWNVYLPNSKVSITPTRDKAVLTEDLCKALLTPRNVEEMSRLLADLCTPAEVRTLAERWHVAQLLDSSDLSYRDIHDVTGVSTTTIVRVARFLRPQRHQAD